MSRPHSEVTRITSLPFTPQEQPEQFVDSRPERPRQFVPPYEFIGQWRRVGGRATCVIASRLNGLIGLGAIETGEARLAHDTLAAGNAFHWELVPKRGRYLPCITTWRLFRKIFNTGVLEACSVEFSDMQPVEELGKQALVSCIEKAARKDVALVLGRQDIPHDFVAVPAPDGESLQIVDSRMPGTPQLQDPEQVADFILGDRSNNYIQLLYDLPRVP